MKALDNVMGLWALGIIPLIVGIIYILADLGMFSVGNLKMWPILVFFFGLFYTIGYYKK